MIVTIIIIMNVGFCDVVIVVVNKDEGGVLYCYIEEFLYINDICYFLANIEIHALLYFE